MRVSSKVNELKKSYMIIKLAFKKVYTFYMSSQKQH